MIGGNYRIIFSAIIGIFFLSSTLLSQISLVEKREEIDSLLISIIGEKNFKKHLTFNKWRSKADRYGNQHGGYVTFENSVVKFVPQTYDLWYDLDLVKGEFLNDRITVDIAITDSSQTIRISGIPNFLKNKKNGKLINQKSAMLIAKKNGLEKGINDWRGSCFWKQDGGDWIRKDSVKILVLNGYYMWNISNDLVLTSTEPCKIGYGEGV